MISKQKFIEIVTHWAECQNRVFDFAQGIDCEKDCPFMKECDKLLIQHLDWNTEQLSQEIKRKYLEENK